jgi:hypothetical protein
VAFIAGRYEANLLHPSTHRRRPRQFLEDLGRAIVLRGEHFHQIDEWSGLLSRINEGLQ